MNNSTKVFKASTICKIAKIDNISNSVKFKRKGKSFNVVYSTDLKKWFLQSVNNEGKFVTIGEII